MTEKAKKWTDESVATLLATVGDASPVSAASVNAAAEALGVSARSVAAKLRQLDREVASLAKEKVPAFTEAEGNDLADFVNENANAFTYKEIAENFAEGKFNSKQIQGKLLALELTSLVRPTEKVEAARTYTPEQEATFISMANAGAFIEEIAEVLGKTVASARGKALSLTRGEQISKIPAQKESTAKEHIDAVDALGDKIATMTVAEIAASAGKTERGIRTLLTRRGIKVADYDGLQKRQKADGKAAVDA